MKRSAREVQKHLFLKRKRQIIRELKKNNGKETFYLKKLFAAKNAACTDAVDPNLYDFES